MHHCAQKSLLVLFTSAGLIAQLSAQTVVVTDDFESGDFSIGWDAIAGTISTPGGADGSTSFVALGSDSGPLGASFAAGASDFSIDFFTRVQETTDRQFNLQVSTGSASPDANGATVNLRHQGGGWAAFNGSWQTISLPSLTAGEWYHVRLTGNGWGSAGASYGIELSDAGGTTFTNSATGLTFRQNGNPDTTTAASFNFNSAFGSNPGFDLDQVTVELEDTPLPDDPNLSLIPVDNPFASVTITPGVPVTVEVLATNGLGVETLTIADSTMITGTDASAFGLLTALPIDIAPGESATLQLSFTPPASPGDYVANLEIASNDARDTMLVLPLAATVPIIGENILDNGDFEADGADPLGWGQVGDGASIAEGIAPGSINSASLPAASALEQAVDGSPDWYFEFYFQAPDTVERAFNVLVFAPGGNLNLRYQGTSDGADNTWNTFANGGWGDGLALPAVQAGATYRMRIVGRGWGGNAPVYDLHLSAPNNPALASSLTELDLFQDGSPTGAPNRVRFSTEFGSGPGFVLDDARFVNGTPPPATSLAITGFEHDADADTSTIHWSAQPGQNYYVYGSDDLVSWLELSDNVAASDEESYTETGVTSSRRYYIVTLEEL